jgi:hypothetical protein
MRKCMASEMITCRADSTDDLAAAAAAAAEDDDAAAADSLLPNRGSHDRA